MTDEDCPPKSSHAFNQIKANIPKLSPSSLALNEISIGGEKIGKRCKGKLSPQVHERSRNSSCWTAWMKESPETSGSPPTTPQKMFSASLEIAMETKLPLPLRLWKSCRKILELIQTVEKALQDLSELGDKGAIKNPLVTKSIECKLPENLKKEWLVYVADGRNAVLPNNRFDSLLAFLKGQESIYETTRATEG